MKTTLRKFYLVCTSILRLHLGINNVVALVVIAYGIYYLASDPIAAMFEPFVGAYNPDKLSHTIAAGVVASFASGVVFLVFGVFLLNWYQKTRLMGTYQAYALDDNDTEHPWGKVNMRFYPQSSTMPHTAVKMRLVHGDIVMDGDGLIIDNRYLVGYYAETGQPERRRSGSFMYVLDGTGRVWEGDYLAIDPNNDRPLNGKGRWVRTGTTNLGTPGGN